MKVLGWLLVIVALVLIAALVNNSVPAILEQITGKSPWSGGASGGGGGSGGGSGGFR